MTIGILATGDELIHGDTLNTNSFTMAQALSAEGLSLGLQMTCSDKDIDIQESIDFLTKKHNIIIITGGLGPTSDDRTRFIFEKLFQIKLIEFPEAVAHISERLSHKRKLHAGDLQQALFPPNATILFNPYGTAMGCHFRISNKLFILLPGPPRECIPMFNHHVLPFLQKQQHSHKVILKWRVFGIPESLIANQLDQSLSSLDCQTGFRYDSPYVELKVRCLPSLVPSVNAVVEPLVSPFIISSYEKKASEELVEKIAKTKMSISIIDEATGGVLQTLIQRPTNYSFLKFYPDKAACLHIYITGLFGYWNQNATQDSTEIIIHYSKDKNKSNEKEERKEFPYPSQSPITLSLAAEWLSFRISNLIDPLH